MNEVGATGGFWQCDQQLCVTLKMCYVLKSDLSSFGACYDEAIKNFHFCIKGASQAQSPR